MTDTGTGQGSVAAFYDWLAPDYDVMTGFEQRFAHEKPFFKLIVEKHGIRSAVDAGCGTGFHSLLLAQLGVEVSAVDVSAAMVERLVQHAEALRLSIQTAVSTFDRLPVVLARSYDAVFCMGNALAHLLSREELQKALAAFATLLRPGGILFAQTLNYDRILARNERIQSVKEQEGRTFIRSYDYEGERIRFNITKLERTTSGVQHTMESVQLRPVLRDEFTVLLKESGFTSVRLHGAITLEEFRPDESKDLVVLAHRSG